MIFRKFASLLRSTTGRALKWLQTHRRAFLRVVLLAPSLLFLGAAVWIVIDGLNDELYTADIGVVLGSEVSRSGQPAASLQARLDKTAELYQDGYFPQVMVSGGVRPPRY